MLIDVACSTWGLCNPPGRRYGGPVQRRRRRHQADPGRRPAARRRLVRLLAVLILVVGASASGVLGLRWFLQPPHHPVSSTAPTGERRAAGDRASRSKDRPTSSPSASGGPIGTVSASPSPSVRHHAASPAPSRTAGGGYGQPTRSTSPSPGGSTADRYERSVADLIDAERAKAGCGPLRYDARLADAARKHSADMAKRGYFDHNTPEGVTPWDRVKAEGYQQPSAENIAAGQRTPQEVVTAWMNSSGHRENILNCSSHAGGVGFFQGGSYGFYWTQDFGYS